MQKPKVSQLALIYIYMVPRINNVSTSHSSVTIVFFCSENLTAFYASQAKCSLFSNIHDFNQKPVFAIKHATVQQVPISWSSADSSRD